MQIANVKVTNTYMLEARNDVEKARLFGCTCSTCYVDDPWSPSTSSTIAGPWCSTPHHLSFMLQWSVACSVELSLPSPVVFLAQVLPRLTRLHPSPPSAMWVPQQRRTHLAPSTPVASSSFEGQVERSLHPLPPLRHRPTKQKSPVDACWLGSPSGPLGLIDI